MKFEVPVGSIDCEDFVRKVIDNAPTAIAMNKDARLVLNWKAGQKQLVGESLEAFDEIKQAGVSKPSKLGAALVDMYEKDFREQIEKLFHEDPDGLDLLMNSRIT